MNSDFAGETLASSEVNKDANDVDEDLDANDPPKVKPMEVEVEPKVVPFKSKATGFFITRFF